MIIYLRAVICWFSSLLQAVKPILYIPYKELARLTTKKRFRRCRKRTRTSDDLRESNAEHNPQDSLKGRCSSAVKLSSICWQQKKNKTSINNPFAKLMNCVELDFYFSIEKRSVHIGSLSSDVLIGGGTHGRWKKRINGVLGQKRLVLRERKRAMLSGTR